MYPLRLQAKGLYQYQSQKFKKKSQCDGKNDRLHIVTMIKNLSS